MAVRDFLERKERTGQGEKKSFFGGSLERFEEEQAGYWRTREREQRARGGEEERKRKKSEEREILEKGRVKERRA